MLRGITSVLQSNQLRSVFTAKFRSYSFESDISLKNLYPNSNQKLTTVSPPQSREDSKFNGYIPIDKITLTYSRSSGPGGQSINKTDTKVDLRFHVQTAEWIPEAVRGRLLEVYKNKINKEGYFIVKSDLTRFQHMNLADALERVRNIIRDLEKEMVPTELSSEKIARIQRNHEKKAHERLFIKRFKSQDKNDRRVG